MAKHDAEINVHLTEDQLKAIDEARGCLTVEGFVSGAAFWVAHQLLASTTPEQRRGAIPAFTKAAKDLRGESNG